jgi:hypothetical protein
MRVRASAAALAALVAAGLAAAPTAAAQVVTVAPERVAAQRAFTVDTTGELVVEFRSDPATCAAAARCGLDGVVRYRPGDGSLVVVRTVAPGGGAARTSATLTLDGSPFADGREGAEVRAQVRRTTPGGARACTDVLDRDDALGFSARGGTVGVGLAPADGQVVETRCGGPSTADVAAVLTTRPVSVAAVPRTGRTLDLREERAFTAAGLTGTVRSTVALRLRNDRPDPEDVDDEAGDRPSRILAVRYAVERVSGGVTAAFAGVADPSRCAVLDACGLTGTTTYAPARGRARATIVAFAPVRVPRARLRAALGGGGGSTRGVDAVFGSIVLDAPARAVTTATPGGAPTPCTETRTAGATFVQLLAEERGPLIASLTPLGRLGETPLRARCPGPVLPAAILDDPLAQAVVPRAALRGRRVVLRLGGRRTLDDGVLRTTLRSDVTIVLRRVRTTERVVRTDADVREALAGG